MKISISRILLQIIDYLIGYKNWGNSKMVIAVDKPEHSRLFIDFTGDIPPGMGIIEKERELSGDVR
ncbi:MAG: hypothetical protein U5O15_10115 [Candidatus Krumholzibacteriota bacterium]|nr:hypothetical protein [Candidatus Krumholzibacteriota bacterium]